MEEPEFSLTPKGYPEYTDTITYKDMIEILFHLNPSPMKFRGMYMDRYADPRNAVHNALLPANRSHK